MSTETKQKPVNDLFDQAMKNYEQALKTGLKLQEDSARLWTQLFNQNATAPDWQKQVKALTEELIPQTQKALNENVKLIEQNGKTSVELLKKAVEGAQATTVQEAQSNFMGLWESSVKAMRETAEAVTQANSRALDSWMSIARKTSGVGAASK